MAAESRGPDRRLLRRVERYTLLWAGLGLAVFLLRAEWHRAFALTGVSLVGIFSFRGLERLALALDPSDPQLGHQSKRSGWRQGFSLLNRQFLLGGSAVAALLLDRDTLPGVLVGLLALPAGLSTEGLLTLTRALRGKEDDGDS